METKGLAKAYIVDDNPSAIELLRRLLADYSVSITGTATDTQQAMTDIVQQEPDLIFLDVEMPGMSGLEFWSQVKQELKPETKVVFYTGYDKYLLEALRREAFDYMLKPATRDELAKIMTRYYEQRLSSMQTVQKQTSSESPLFMILGATGDYSALHLDDIAFFRYESERKLWEVILSNGSSSLLRHRTTAEVILAYSHCFVQIHKRYIVNMQKIDKIQDSICILRPPLQHIDELRVSKIYRRELMATFYNM